MDKSLLSRLDPNEKLKLVEQESILLNSTSTLPKTIVELPTKSYVDIKFNGPSIKKNFAHVQFNVKNRNNVKFFGVNSMHAVREHLKLRIYVDETISFWVDESSLLGLDPDEKLKLNEQDSLFLNSTLTSPNTIKELPTKSYVDTLREINRNRRDLSSVFNNQDNEFDKIEVIRDRISDNELSIKKDVDDSLGEGTIVRFNETSEKYLKVSVGNDTCNLTESDILQITHTTEIIFPNNGSDLLQKWYFKCNNMNIGSKVGNFI